MVGLARPGPQCGQIELTGFVRTCWSQSPDGTARSRALAVVDAMSSCISMTESLRGTHRSANGTNQRIDCSPTRLA
jgi:hypothetical protein